MAIYRRNSLLAGSFEGAKRLARYMTIIGNCKLAGVNPHHYLTDVLTRCGRGWPVSRLSELLPKVWTPTTSLLGMPALSEHLIRY